LFWSRDNFWTPLKSQPTNKVVRI